MCKERRLWRQTLFLVGPALAAAGTRSHLYHAGHFHTFRKPEREARKALRAARSAASPRDAGPRRLRRSATAGQARPAERDGPAAEAGGTAAGGEVAGERRGRARPRVGE